MQYSVGDNPNELFTYSESVRRSRAWPLWWRLNTLLALRLQSQCNAARRSSHKITEAEKTDLLYPWPIKERISPLERSGCVSDRVRQPSPLLLRHRKPRVCAIKSCRSDSIQSSPISATVMEPVRWWRRRSTEVFILSHAGTNCTNLTSSQGWIQPAVWGGGGNQARGPNLGYPKNWKLYGFNPLFFWMDPSSLSKKGKKAFWELYDAPFLGFRGPWPGPSWIRQCNRLELTKLTKPLAAGMRSRSRSRSRSRRSRHILVGAGAGAVETVCSEPEPEPEPEP